MKYINAFWFTKHKSPNFGDEITPYLFEKLSNKKVKRVFVFPTKHNKVFEVIILLKGWLFNKYNFSDVKAYFYGWFVKQYILSIGSILHFNFSPKAIVWGAGIIHAKSNVNPAKFIAVRGSITQNRIKALGYIAPDVIGDPAVLLPKIYSSKTKKKYKLGIIPHIVHFEELSKYQSDEVLVIDFKTKNIEKVIDEICACELLFSTSLHGLIVPQSYGIPSIWCEIKDHPLSGDNTKFFDYFSAFDLQCSDPKNIHDLMSQYNKDKTKILDLIENNKHHYTIQKDKLDEVQNNLLNNLPF